ncbi:hypothetical protein H4R34_002275 [Dimargaris verticillata]|uniref:Rab-GAP TBC domain-containing protein n=1 Tax=Dimargaris verticillata TaxID=2761393 RepID=A0A9W8B8A8_9FUNG|nr:hypothetical protein H4R34_002275 [Dimargaris verticillata]
MPSQSSSYKQRLKLFEQALFGGKDARVDMGTLRVLCFHGIPDQPGLRALCWKLLLNYLPADKRDWFEALSEKRTSYYNFVKELIVDPTLPATEDGQPLDGPDSFFSADHPLNANPQSRWNTFLQDNALLEEIDKDVRRTLPDFAFFQQPVTPSPFSPLTADAFYQQQLVSAAPSRTSSPVPGPLRTTPSYSLDLERGVATAGDPEWFCFSPRLISQRYSSDQFSDISALSSRSNTLDSTHWAGISAAQRRSLFNRARRHSQQRIPRMSRGGPKDSKATAGILARPIRKTATMPTNGGELPPTPSEGPPRPFAVKRSGSVDLIHLASATLPPPLFPQGNDYAAPLQVPMSPPAQSQPSEPLSALRHRYLSTPNPAMATTSTSQLEQKLGPATDYSHPRSGFRRSSMTTAPATDPLANTDATDTMASKPNANRQSAASSERPPTTRKTPPPPLRVSTNPCDVAYQLTAPPVTSSSPVRSASLSSSNESLPTQSSGATSEPASDLHWEAIERILFIYAKLNRGIGYVQGMNEIVGPLYYVLAQDVDEESRAHAEADAFYLFTQVMAGPFRDHFVRALDTDPYTGIQASMNQFSQMLKQLDAPLWHHLEAEQLHPTYYSLRWFTVLCSQEFNLPDVIRLWDAIFADMTDSGVPLVLPTTTMVPSEPTASRPSFSSINSTSTVTTPSTAPATRSRWLLADFTVPLLSSSSAAGAGPPSIYQHSIRRLPGGLAFLVEFCCSLLLEIRDVLFEGTFGENLKLLQNYPLSDVSPVLKRAIMLRHHCDQAPLPVANPAQEFEQLSLSSSPPRSSPAFVSNASATTGRSATGGGESWFQAKSWRTLSSLSQNLAARSRTLVARTSMDSVANGASNLVSHPNSATVAGAILDVPWASASSRSPGKTTTTALLSVAGAVSPSATAAPSRHPTLFGNPFYSFSHAARTATSTAASRPTANASLSTAPSATSSARTNPSATTTSSSSSAVMMPVAERFREHIFGLLPRFEAKAAPTITKATPADLPRQSTTNKPPQSPSTGYGGADARIEPSRRHSLANGFLDDDQVSDCSSPTSPYDDDTRPLSALVNNNL